MKQLALTLSIFSACCRLAFAGTAYTGKEMKQVRRLALPPTGTPITNGT